MKRGKILLIDDDDRFIEVMQEFMDMEGFEFSGVALPLNIDYVVTEFQPDLIILDYRLNGCSSEEICLTIRENPLTASIPIIMLSAYPENQIPLSRLPVNTFIPKPIDLWSFSKTLEQLLKNTGWHN